MSVLIAGATGSGKSALALELALNANGTIINADAMQVYGELRVLSARPNRVDEAAVPHRLYGMACGSDAWSAGGWCKHAYRESCKAHVEGRCAIFVGGTGLYFEALLGGLADIPEIPSDIRAKWRTLLEENGLDSLRRELKSKDPDLPPDFKNDRQRVLRALEVLDATGHPLSWWHGRSVRAPSLEGSVIKFVVAPPRRLLHEKIEARAWAMIDNGAIEEVRKLISLKYDDQLPIMKAIGVRELRAVLDHELSIDEALERICTQTRRYAKRQITWSRGRMTDWHWVASPEEGLEHARRHLSSC